MSRTPAQIAAPLAVSIVPDTLGLEEAADYLRLGRDATRLLWETGALPGVSLNQKHLVFRRAALDSFLARLEAEQQAARRAGRTPPPANDPAPPPARRNRRNPLPDLGRYEIPETKR